MIIRMTKKSSLFGRLEEGTKLDIKVPDNLGGEQESCIRARRMMERDHSDENQMEWDTEILDEPKS